jgi:tRNA dimethylallyltransferase
MRAIGVRELSAYLEGHVTMTKAIEAGQQATRRYAKRQYTWFAHQPPESGPRFFDIPLPVRPELVEGLSFVQGTA